jgi:hypothetical protein
VALPAGIDISQLPAFNLTPEDDRPKPGPIIGGLAAGYHQLVGLGGSAIEGVGNLAGLDSVANYGKSVADNQAATAARVGRPDLEIAPWQQGGASVAPWLEYQAAKLAPTLAGYAAAQFIPGVDATVDATGLARLGAVLPEFLGGGGLEAGASFAARKAALETGAGLGKFAVGGGVFGGVTGFGQAIQSADAKPGGATHADAVQAAAEAPLYAAAGLLEPGFLRGALSGAEGTLAGRVISKALAGAAVGGVQSSMLTGLDQTFRPDLTPQQKTSNIVDSFLTGASVGGLFGGATGVRALKHADATAIDTPTLEQSIDQTLNLGDPNQATRTGVVAPLDLSDTGQATKTGVVASLDLGDSDRLAPPVLFGPDSVADRSTLPGSTIVVGRRNEGGQFTSEATGVEHPPVVPEDTSRAFRNFTDEELASAGNALSNKREAAGKLTAEQNQIAKGIDEELAFRRSQPDRNGALTVADAKPAAEAVEQPANQRGTGEQNSAAPASTSAPIQTRIDELTNGLRLPATLKEKLATARSEDDIQNIVHDEVIVDGKGGKMRDALAARVGVLDNEGKPTSLADEISARKTAPGEQAPTPAADAAFKDRWKQDVQQTGQKDPAVRSLNPTSEVDAQTQIYRALGDKGVKSDADGLEKIAQKYGVLNDNKQLTPLALEIAKRDPISTADAVKAAVAQGYKGADASMFDKGVQAHIEAGEKVTSFDTPQAREAYEAGAKWAEETNSVPTGALKKYEAAPAHTVTDEQRALGQKVEVKKATIPAEVKQAQLVNEAIDNAGLHPATHESEIAQLKSMVRDGDIDGAMKGLQRVQRGEKLFEEPQPGAETSARPRADNELETPFGKTVIPDRNAIERAKMQMADRYEAEQRSTLKPEEKEAIRAHDAKLIAQHDVIEDIKDAQQAGEISVGKSMMLRMRAEKGDIAGARAGLPDRLKPSKYMFIQGKAQFPTMDRIAAKRVINVARSSLDGHVLMHYLGTLPGELGAMARRFAKLIPHDLQVEVVSREEMDANPQGGPGTYGLYFHNNHGIVLAEDMPHPSIALHEIAHAIIGDHIEQQTPIGKEISRIFNEVKKFGTKGDYAFTDAGEFMSEFLSRKQVRDWVQKWSDEGKLGPTSKGNVFQRIWQAIKEALGGAPKGYVEKLLNLAEEAGRNPAETADGLYATPSKFRTDPSAVNERVSGAVKDIGELADRFTERTDIKGKLLGAQLYWGDRHHLVEMFSKWFQRPNGSNPLRDVELHERQRVAINAKLTQPSTDVLDRHAKLLNSDRKSGENVQRIMRTTEFPFDYSKSWKNQTEEVRKLPQLQALHQQYHDLWRSLSPEGRGVLADFRALNDVQMLQYRSMLLHAEAVANPTTSQALGLTIHDTPVDQFRAQQATFNPAETRAWWMQHVNDQMTALTNHIASETHGADKDTIAAKGEQFAPITDAVKETQEAIARIESKPYFHLPRFGDFFVDWKVKDQQALARVADALDGKGFNGIISKDSDQNHVFMRLENAAQQKALATIIDGLKTGGHVTDWNVGRLSDDKYSAGILNKGLDRLVQTIQNNPALDKEARDTAVAGLRKTILDLMPESAISRVMTHRDNIPGYDGNMVRGFAQRYKIGVDSLSGAVVAPKIAQAYTDIRGMIRDAQKAPLSEVSLDQRNNMQRVADEMSRRQREMADWGHNKYLDLLGRVTSAHYLGLSPAFGFVQLSQLGVVTLPELGSQFGFVRSAREIAKATPLAFKIMAQVFAEGKKVSLTRAMDAVVTRDALLKTPGVNARMADFLMNIVDSGHIDLGGQIRELVRAAEGSDEQHFDKAMRYATSIGYYSETMSRLIAAIATHNVHDGKLPVPEVADKARHILDESLFNFSAENWGRAFGKKGFLGSATPLATKFMQYTAQLTGKLYREAHAAMGGDKQAQRFLVQHLGMMTVLAGTLGLPMVTAFAAAYDKLKDEFADKGEKPSDIRSDYREYMSHVFGKGIEPLIDKGLSRGIGVDVSQRLGEADIVPFSRFIADRRNVKDSLSDLESRSWGAPTSMIAAYAEGISKISQGDVLGGLTAALPLGLSNPIKAYRMEQGQFVDAKGNVLPIEPSTRDVIVQALGFNPAQKADYSDRLGAEKTSAMLLNQQAASLRSQMVEAMKNKDTATMQVLAHKIAEFDRANPLTPASRGIASSYRRQIEQSSIAAKTQQPLGVKPGAGRYTYGDIQFSNALGNQTQ